MFYSVDEFLSGMANRDFQRSNLFSVVFATSPASRILDSTIGSIRDTLIDGTMSSINANNPNEFMNAITGGVSKLFSYTVDKAIMSLNKTGFSKIMGALSPRLITSLFGDSVYGQMLTEFRDKMMYNMGLSIVGVQLPGKTLGYEYVYNGGVPQIRFTRPENGELSLTFRVDSEARNLKVFNEWLSAIRDDITGQFAFIDEVSSAIQVNLHNRDGVPHSTYVFQKCLPVKVSNPELSYESNNEIWTFTVDFAYKTGWLVEADKEGWDGFKQSLIEGAAIAVRGVVTGQ
ncbi:baseplate tail tube initiator [Escherichia phage UPEC03]|uniref:Baseplate tail-tube junction protein n=3 Tax=Pseudotevenvirus TaxID=2842979 RepID=A0A8E7KXR7_9CAUD|nr:baseplate hub protein [Enterobacter phage EBPL]QUL77033.1 baseplate tail tube initiator [Escherichia phage UPEC03]QVW27433.1 baseplate tail-tube junction protein [Cronobacter phage JC03]BCM29426.1 baseplate hub protein [Enterobacter phage vB_EkoM5VN]